jgi:hypothetical protein
VPYLVSRPDPWDKLSPYHRWGPFLVGARTVQSKLATAGRVLDAHGVATPSGRLRTLTLDTTAGSEQVPATLVRTALGFRSTWLTIGVLRLDRASSGSVVFGSTTHLSGLGRGLGATRLESSFDGVAWATAASDVPDAAGAVSFDVMPTRTTRYRLGAEGGASPALLVQVAPRLALTKPTAVAPGVLSGSVRPKLPGATIAIERRKGSNWTLVGDAVVGATGVFEVALDARVPAGSYRARSDATAAFAAGMSPTMVVSG